MPLVALSVYSEMSPPEPRLQGEEPDIAEIRDPHSESLWAWLRAHKEGLSAPITRRRIKAAALIGCALLGGADQSPPSYTECVRVADAALQTPTGTSPRMLVVGDGAVSVRRPAGKTVATFQAADSTLAQKQMYAIPEGVTDYIIHDPVGKPTTRIVALLPQLVSEASTAMTRIHTATLRCGSTEQHPYSL